MITDVYVVYNSIEQMKKVEDSFKDKESPTFHFIDALSNKTKKEAWSIKSHWAAKEDPFAIIMNGDKAIKAFYSEADDDIITSLINYIDRYESACARRLALQGDLEGNRS